ncbi:acyl-CoA dehydrogenase family protein [Deltaproteobacteria bacterium TL4]
MDQETQSILRETLEDWCNAHKEQWLKELEAYQKNPTFPEALFNELQKLGILDILHTPETSRALDLVAETAYTLARYSPSLALLVVQQNMAGSLLASAGLDAPDGWVALPLFDHPQEWQHYLKAQKTNNNLCYSGQWTFIPALPIAKKLMLPLFHTPEEPNLLIFVDYADAHVKYDSEYQRKPVEHTLGLRGCPVGDLTLNHVDVLEKQKIMTGARCTQVVTTLWSQAEVYMLAIRSGILQSSYAHAQKYAAQRYQGGKIIQEHTVMKKMLSELYRDNASLYESWRGILMSLKPENSINDGQMGLALSSAEKLSGQTSNGIQIFGGNGYMEDYEQERRFRDAKQCEFLLGHPQIKSISLWQKNAA